MINSREDLDAIEGTQAHADFMALLAGSVYRIEKDEAEKLFRVVTDTATIARFGLSLSDFPDLKAPLPPDYVLPSDEELAAQIRAEREPLLLLADRKVNTLEDKGEDASAWRAWRDKLRNITLQPTFPHSVTWPEQPA